MSRIGEFPPVLQTLALVVASFWPATAAEIGAPSAPAGAPHTKQPAKASRGVFFLTQNVDPHTVEYASPTCNAGGVTTDNQFYRVFDLDGDHGLAGEVCAKGVEFGVGLAEGAPDIEVTVSCLSEPISNAALEAGLVHSTILSHADASNSFANVAVEGCCDAGSSDMAVGVRSEDCLETGDCVSFFIGSNFEGQLKPAYMAAPDCGISEPVDTCLVTFCDDQIVINAYVEGSLPEVPASSAQGLVLTAALLVLLGSIVRHRLRCSWRTESGHTRPRRSIDAHEPAR